MFTIWNPQQFIQKCFVASKTFPEPQRNPKLPITKLFINNKWVDSASRETFPTVNPSNGEVITEVPRGGKEDVDSAVRAAHEAFDLDSPWRRMDASKRGKLINRLADLVERDKVYLASLETLECGKIYTSAFRVDLTSAIRKFRYFAGLSDKNDGAVPSPDGFILAYTRQEPVGVCGIITAWNFSTSLICAKLAPALAAGCTVIVKPSEHTSLAALHLGALAKEAGFPSGVVNIVTGFGDIGSEIVKHPLVRMITFTGSNPVGRHIYREGAETMKRITLMLGGKSPNIILPDANVDDAVKHAHFAMFENMGQCCCAGSRTYVHKSQYEEFVEKSKASIESIRIGDPFDLSTEFGPQGSKDHLKNVLRMIETGKKEGATLVVGGKRIDRPGYYVEPTMFADVKDDMTIAREEIFGPVQTVLSYTNLEEVVNRANDSEFGLAASIFGKNIDDINTAMQRLQVGSVWINCYFIVTPQTPFGGYKLSGLRREGGIDSLKEFTETKAVFIKIPTKNS